MLSIYVKFTTGTTKHFEDVDPKYTNIGGGILTVGINQKVDANGKWISGTAIRMPFANIQFFETTDTGEGITVEGEGKVKE